MSTTQTHRLLPIYKSATTKPAYILDLNIPSEIIQHVKNRTKLKIKVKNGQMSLILKENTGNDQELTTTQIPLQKKEYDGGNKTIIYKQFSQSTFKNFGQVEAALSIDPSANSLIPTVNDNVSTSSDIKSKSQNAPTQSKIKPRNPQLAASDDSPNPPAAAVAAAPAAASPQPPVSTPVNRSPLPPQSPAFVNTSKSPTNFRHNNFSMRVLYLLALRPASIDELIMRTTYPPHEIEEAVLYLGVPYHKEKLIKDFPDPRDDFQEGVEYWVLKHMFYKDLRFFKSRSINDYEKKQLMLNCWKVFDALKYAKNHPSRIYIEENRHLLKAVNKDDRNSGNPSKRVSVPPPPPQKKPNGSQLEKRQTPNKKERSTEPESQGKKIPSKPPNFPSDKRQTIKPPVFPSSEKRTEEQKELKSQSFPKSSSNGVEKDSQIPNSTRTDPNNEKKRKRVEDGNDEEFYRNLAKKFKSKYREYKSLYGIIQNNKEKRNNEEELKKLFELHKNLESWKKQLWNSVSSK